MTQAERLIRNLCDETRRAITAEKETAVADSAFTVPLTDTSVAVQRAVRVLADLTVQERKAVAVIVAAGYEVPNAEDAITHLTLPYKERNAGKSAAYRQANARLASVARLQSDAVIKSLGKKGADARGVLEQLQKALAKV